MANTVKIVVDAVDKTKKGLTSPIKNMKDLGKAVSNLAPAFAAAASAATAAFAAMARSEINVLDQTAKLAARLGVSTETLSTMTHASNLAGTSMDSLKNAFKTLGQRAVDSTRGLKSVNDDFNLLGVEVTDANGRMKDTETLFLEIADAVSKMDDGLTKAGVASKLLGRQGLELIPLLNQGANGIKRMQEEARSLGLEINANTAAQAEKFNDDLVRLKGLATGMTRTFLVEALPALIEMTEGLVNAGKQSGFFEGAARTMADTLLAVARAGAGVVAVFKLLGGMAASNAAIITQVFVSLGEVVKVALSGIEEAFKKTGAAFNNFTVGNFARAGELMGEAAETMGQGFEGVGPEAQKQLGLVTQAMSDAASRAETDAKRLFDAFAGANQPGPGGSKGTGASAQNLPGIGDPVEATQQVQVFVDKVEKEFERLTETKAALLSMEIGDRMAHAMEVIKNEEQLNATLEQLGQIYSIKRDELRQADLEKEKQAADFLRELQMQAQAHWMGDRELEIAAAEEDHARKLERIEELATSEENARELKFAAEHALQVKLLAIEEKAAAMKAKIQDGVLQGWQQSLGIMAQTAATFFGQESAAFKAFAIAEAIINTYRGANRALAENPWPLNLVAMAAVIGAGIANVATISGVAHGGITEVPSDQTFLLKKGERVLSPGLNEDLTEALENGGVGGGKFEITINLDGQALWEAMGRASRDGRLEISPRAIA